MLNRAPQYWPGQGGWPAGAGTGPGATAPALPGYVPGQSGWGFTPGGGFGGTNPQSPAAGGGASGAGSWGGSLPDVQTQTRSGQFPSVDILADPVDAAIRVLRRKGLNPGSFDPFVTSVIKRAGDLVNELVMDMAGGQYGGLGTLQDSESALGALMQLVNAAGAGAKIYGGHSKSELAGLTGSMERNRAGTGSIGDAIIDAYLSDTGRAHDFLQTVLYGGLSPYAQSAMSRALFTPMSAYSEQLAAQPETTHSFLQYLVSQLTGQVPPVGTQSLGTPSALYGQTWPAAGR